MKRLIVATAIPVALFLPAASMALPGARAGCRKLFTPAMGERAARAIYRNARTATLQNLRLMGYIERCQRDPSDQARVRAFDRRQRLAARRIRRAHPSVPPMSYAVASWYDDSVGQTACGYHAGNGVANKFLACGTHVMFSYHGRTTEATVDDRGPYIGGRDWDLNQNTAAALGFNGVDTVGYHIGGSS